MANGETLREIRQILANDDKVSQQVVNRLILSLTAEMYEALKDTATAKDMREVSAAQKDAAEKEDARHLKLDNDLKIVKDKSIVIWIERNKPIAALIGTLVFIVFLVGQSVAVPAIAKAFGVPLP